MPLTVYTARLGYRGDDALNITRKSAARDGLAFAPSWALLGPALRARRALELKQVERSEVVESVLRGAAADGAEAAIAFEIGTLETAWNEAWQRYVVGFREEMRASYRANRAAWDALLAREVVTLCCFCSDPERCHRTLVAREILPKLGAIYGGER